MREHLHIDQANLSLHLQVKFSISDQMGQETKLYIQIISDITCPYAFTTKLLTLHSNHTGQLFCHFGGFQVTRYHFSSVLNTATSALNLDTTAYGLWHALSWFFILHYSNIKEMEDKGQINTNYAYVYLNFNSILKTYFRSSDCLDIWISNYKKAFVDAFLQPAQWVKSQSTKIKHYFMVPRLWWNGVVQRYSEIIAIKSSRSVPKCHLYPLWG